MVWQKHGGGLADVIELNTDPGPLVAQIAERIHRAQTRQKSRLIGTDSLSMRPTRGGYLNFGRVAPSLCLDAMVQVAVKTLNFPAVQRGNR